MQIAILTYDYMTALDAIGPYEVLSRVAGAEIVLVAREPGIVRCDNGLGLIAETAIDAVCSPDVLVVPGWTGAPQDELLSEGELREWLRTVDASTTWTASTGTGSIVLASAGILRRRRATTHWLTFEELGHLGAIAVDQRIVIDGKYVTSAGASAGIEMALTLAAAIAGEPLARAIQLSIEYDPQPPFDSGSTAKAPPEIVSAMRSVKDFIVYGGVRRASGS